MVDRLQFTIVISNTGNSIEQAPHAPQTDSENKLVNFRTHRKISLARIIASELPLSSLRSSMKRFDQKVLGLMLPPLTIAERARNIAILKEHNQFSFLEPTGDENILFRRNDVMPRYLERYLIVDFDRKRSMISEILFDIYQTYPGIFPLTAYSDVARQSFSVLTKYRWSGEDAGIVIHLIAIHIRPYLRDIRDIPESFIISTFQQHDATLYFDTEEIRDIIRSCTNEYDISINKKCEIDRTASDSIEDVRYLQKIFRRNFKSFAKLFGADILLGFISKDTNAIVNQKRTTRTYIQIFQQILLNKIDTLNITSEKKIAYRKRVTQKPILGAILFLSDILLKRM